MAAGLTNKDVLSLMNGNALDAQMLKAMPSALSLPNCSLKQSLRSWCSAVLQGIHHWRSRYVRVSGFH